LVSKQWIEGQSTIDVAFRCLFIHRLHYILDETEHISILLSGEVQSNETTGWKWDIYN
jgi:hypothetical protein